MRQAQGRLRSVRAAILQRGIQHCHQRQQFLVRRRDKGQRQRACNIIRGGRDAAQHRDGKGLHHPLGVRGKSKAVNGLRRNVEQLVIGKLEFLPVNDRRRMARLDKEHLRQLGMPMRRDPPTMIGRAVLDMFAMYHIRKGVCFAI